MGAEVMTVVDATVDQEREHDLLDGFRDLIAGPKPDGLLRSELLRGPEGLWRIQTTWRDRDALVAMRKAGRPPAALALLDRLGAEHTHGVFSVEESYHV